MEWKWGRDAQLRDQQEGVLRETNAGSLKAANRVNRAISFADFHRVSDAGCGAWFALSRSDVIESEFISRAVPIANHPDDLRMLVDSIDDSVRLQNELANQPIIKFGDDTAGKRKDAQSLRLLDQCQTEAFRGFGTICATWRTMSLRSSIDRGARTTL